MEFFRIPHSNLVMPEKVSDATAEMIYAVEEMGGNVKPVIVSRIGMNKETFETEYKVLLNDEMVIAVKANRLENVNCMVIDESELKFAKMMF